VNEVGSSSKIKMGRLYGLTSLTFFTASKNKAKIFKKINIVPFFHEYIMVKAVS
jgi:hypothetical protein